jgi:ferredoxin
MEGIELLVPPEPAEQELLDLLGRFANRRLACQTRIRPGAGLIRIKPAGA